MSRTAVVLGGAGFLGSHLVERLLGEGVKVICVDSFITGDPRGISYLLGNPQLRLVEADVSESLNVSGSVDYVIHLASPASPVDYLKLPIETLRAGSLGTMNALDLAHEKGARFLLASTSEVYGDPQVHPQTESYWGNVNPIGPRGVYDEAKRFAEAITMAYRRSHAVNTGIMRIFNTYGPGMRPDDGRVVTTFLRQALRGDSLPVAGDGSQTRSFCYVDDLIEGAVRLLLTDIDGPMNIGNPREQSVLDLAHDVIAVTGSASDIVFVDLPEDDPLARQPDIDLARRLLGWEPRVSLHDGLSRTAEWLRQELNLVGQASTGAAART
ncbi:MAG: UDP-glucuronic acid decarboxylase family protein [Actinomycetes bacterium]